MQVSLLHIKPYGYFLGSSLFGLRGYVEFNVVRERNGLESAVLRLKRSSKDLVGDFLFPSKAVGKALLRAPIWDVDGQPLIYERWMSFNVDGYSLRVRLPASFSAIVPNHVRIITAEITRYIFDGGYLSVGLVDIFDYIPFKRGGSYKRGDRMCRIHGWFDREYLEAREKAGKQTLRCVFCNRQLRTR